MLHHSNLILSYLLTFSLLCGLLWFFSSIIVLILGEEDTLIPCEYSRAIVASYSGDCQLMLVKGDHNDARPIKFQRRARAYFKRLLRGGLKKPEDLFGGDDPGRAGRELETS